MLTYGAKDGAHVHNLKLQLWIAKKFPPKITLKRSIRFKMLHLSIKSQR